MLQLLFVVVVVVVVVGIVVGMCFERVRRFRRGGLKAESWEIARCKTQEC